MWNTIINVGLLILSSIIYMTCADFIYHALSPLYRMPRPTFDALVYGLMGFYKTIICVFNIVPYFSLLLMKPKQPERALIV